jgi:hypothetical protein
MQAAEDGELVFGIGLRLCRDDLESSEVQDFAAVGEKVFLVANGEKSELFALIAGCSAGAGLHLGLHALPLCTAATD